MPATLNVADTLSTLKTIDAHINDVAHWAREQRERRKIRLHVAAYNYGISWDRLQVSKIAKAPVSVPVEKLTLVERVTRVSLKMLMKWVN